jgi:cystathionine beta-lyase
MLDNTWSAGVYFKPFEHGVDVSIQALTKYQAGHSDVFAGAILTADERLGAKIAAAGKNWGFALAPEDAYLVLRGLRSLPVRLARHDESARKIATFLAGQPQVRRVRHPALPDDPGHALWARDFTGAAGLFAFELADASPGTDDRFLSALKLFGLGFSWGGYESLAISCDPQLDRTVTDTRVWGPLIRLSIGLEDPDDLIGDLAAALAALA